MGPSDASSGLIVETTAPPQDFVSICIVPPHCPKARTTSPPIDPMAVSTTAALGPTVEPTTQPHANAVGAPLQTHNLVVAMTLQPHSFAVGSCSRHPFGLTVGFDAHHPLGLTVGSSQHCRPRPSWCRLQFWICCGTIEIKKFTKNSNVGLDKSHNFDTHMH
ncbi:hypothetical protein L3X38_003861 [Prunus dulcis]|uniref:Uncharacterized protein n=1 Tax=Prunus dulcis TaxID=3755 RepID=A0AAD4ZMW4_PRUDU|nr:hypothetical protein L3X38_003861 [Prunus dulcis]